VTRRQNALSIFASAGAATALTVGLSRCSVVAALRLLWGDRMLATQAG